MVQVTTNIYVIGFISVMHATREALLQKANFSILNYTWKINGQIGGMK